MQGFLYLPPREYFTMIYESIPEMSKDLGVTRQTVYNRIKSGKVVVIEGPSGVEHYVRFTDLLKVLTEALTRFIHT